MFNKAMNLAKRRMKKKKNFTIKVKLFRINAVTDDDMTFVIGWKRGPQEEYTSEIEMTNIDDDMECDYVFQRTSTFYEEADGSFEKKICDFTIYSIMDSGERILVGSAVYDMSVHVNKENEQAKIEFENSTVKDCSIELEWTISEELNNKADVNARMSLAKTSLMSDLLPEGLDVKEMME
jgi:hypothetical protein